MVPPYRCLKTCSTCGTFTFADDCWNTRNDSSHDRNHLFIYLQRLIFVFVLNCLKSSETHDNLTDSLLIISQIINFFTRLIYELFAV